MGAVSCLALCVNSPALGIPSPAPGLCELSFGMKEELGDWFSVQALGGFPSRCSNGASPPLLAGFLLVPLAHGAATSVPLLGMITSSEGTFCLTLSKMSPKRPWSGS